MDARSPIPRDARKARAAERKAIKDAQKASAERWAEAEANADRTLAGLPPRWDEPPESTFRAARLIVRSGDVARLKRFLDGRPEHHVAAIIKRVSP